MSQVSGKVISPEVEERIDEVFCKALADIKNKEQAKEFLETFFTATEKVNLPKRFGIFLLLYKGEDYETIKNKLKVSLPTIASVQKQILIHGFGGMKKTIEKIIKENKPEQEYDPDPALFRGKRVFRRQAVQKPYSHLPY